MKNKNIAKVVIVLAGLNLAAAAIVMAEETTGPCQAGATTGTPSGSVGGAGTSSSSSPSAVGANPH